MFREHFKNVPGKCSEKIAFRINLAAALATSPLKPCEPPPAPWARLVRPCVFLEGRQGRGPTARREAPQRSRGSRLGPKSWMATIRKRTRVPILLTMRVSAAMAKYPDKGRMLLRIFLG